MQAMRHRIVSILFVLSMIVMAVFLAVAATLICCVKVLEPRHLTPIVRNFADKALDADVRLDKVELSFRPAFPVLNLSVDTLAIVSRAFDGMPAADTDGLPRWRDSLLTLDRFSGSVNIGALISCGAIELHDVELDGVGLGIVIARDGTGNFDIYEAADSTAAQADTVSSPLIIPPFSIDRFAFVRPKEIRYFNAADSTSATVVLLHDMTLSRDDRPAYSLRIDGHVHSPLTRSAINLEDISFGLDGKVRWRPEQPSLLALERFTVRGAFIEAGVDTELDFDSTLTVRAARLELKPVAVTDMLTLLPDSLRRANRLIAPYFTTDAAVSMTAELLKPFCMATDSIPDAKVTLTMPDSRLHYGKADIRQLGFDISATTHGQNLDSAVVGIHRVDVAGPATHLRLEGTVTKLMSDPDFDLCMQGDIELASLPPFVADLAQGFISGHVDTDIDATGRMSMLSADNFHRLDLRGKLEGRDLYYLSNDTAKMAEVHRLNIAFGSKVKVADSVTRKSSPMLAAGIKIDSATVLVDGVNIGLGDFALAAGVENSRPSADTTLVVPVGGRIKVGRLNIVSVTDSAGARMRGLSGRVSLHRYKNSRRVPEIVAKLDIDRLAAGTTDTRLFLAKAHLDASTHKIPSLRGNRKEIKQMADSIRKVHPELSPDSVFKLAIEKRRRKPGERRRPRVHGQMTAEDYEVIEWGLSKGFRKYLLGWELHGTLKTGYARLFTPAFPLRNRITRLDIAFSNDSVSLNSMRYKAGHSDLSVHGLISNIKKGLTSKRAGNSLKLNFDITSDTIDVNQLAAAAFAGAAYMERVRNGGEVSALSDVSESELDRSIQAIASEQPDSVGPLLVPANIDAKINVRAANILYSDLAMTDMTGEVLVYDGGVNLHKLAAKSDAGDLNFTAVYSAPKPTDIRLGFGLDLERFNIERFLSLVPAVDSVMPLMRDFSGIIDAELAATVDIDSGMNMVLPTLDAAVRLTGDSLAFINPETYATLGKWLRFRDRADNKIKHMNVEMIVRDNRLQIFPFSFDIDRYRLGVVGYNDLNLNFDYHIAVLKSPIPFRFGITLKGNPDKYKVRFGGAKFREGEVAESVGVVDTARVNLIQQIEGVFRRGVSKSRFARLNVSGPNIMHQLEAPDPGLSASDSLALIREGLIEAPKVPQTEPETQKDNGNKRSKRRR